MGRASVWHFTHLFAKSWYRSFCSAGKLKGQPVLSTLTVETVKKPAPAAEAKTEEVPTSTGGLGSFLAKAVAKKVVPKEEPRSTLLTSSSELLSISKAVAEADVALPAGYQAR